MTPTTESMGGQWQKDVEHLKAKVESMERLLFCNDETIRHVSQAVLDLGKQNIALRKRLADVEGREWRGGCRA